MSHLALHLGDPDEAIRLAGGGTAKLKEGPANPELAARLVALEARGRAARGESAACTRLLLQAEQILDAVLPAEPSTWISRFDEASLASEAARCMRQLGQLVPARREAERVVALRSGDRARSRAFGQLILAHVLIEERDLDAASAVGRDVLDGTQALGSFLVVRQLQRLRDLLATDHRPPAHLRHRPGGHRRRQPGRPSASGVRGAVGGSATLDSGSRGGVAVMWTAIWTALGFVLLLFLLLFLGDSILTFTAEQLRERRTYRLALERERTYKLLSPTSETS